MNIQKENMYMNKVKTKNIFQLTLDNDYIISDKKSDINRIVRQVGEVLIDEYKVHTDKVEVKGRVRIAVLYISEDENTTINSITEYMQFYENINIPGITSMDVININGELEDLSVNIINSRKISVKTLLNLATVIDEESCVEVVTNVDDDEMMECKKRDLEVTRLVINKKDIYRIRDEVVLQSSKKNISEILYFDVGMVRCNTRLADEKIILKGDLLIFIMYLTEDGEYECLEKEITYNGDVELYEARENMIGNILVSIVGKEINIKNDDDGEPRVIDIDVTLNLDIKCYMEDRISIIDDVYALDGTTNLDRKEIEYERFLLKNNTSTRIEDAIELKENNDVLQVCNSVAAVKIDDISIRNDVDNGEGIYIEGVIESNIIYISSKDNRPINSITHITPFEHLIEVSGISDNSIYNINPSIEDVSIMMLAAGTLELKITLSVDAIVFNSVKENVIVGLEKEKFDKNERDNIPSMIGYMVKDDEDLWLIGKKFNTSVDMLKKINPFVDNSVKAGDKLLIVKSKY